MEISIEKQNDTAIVVAGGRLDAAGAPSFEASCKTLIQEGAKRLLLDLARVEYISSASLRSLLVLAKAVKSSGGAMVLCNLVPAVREVMTLSGFDNILSLATDRAAAMEQLK
jgi:stage II sporulation protein AA (anti-sigma F factor antagonist)